MFGDYIKNRSKEEKTSRKKKPPFSLKFDDVLDDLKLLLGEPRTGSHYGSIKEQKHKGMPP